MQKKNVFIFIPWLNGLRHKYKQSPKYCFNSTMKHFLNFGQTFTWIQFKNKLQKIDTADSHTWKKTTVYVASSRN